MCIISTLKPSHGRRPLLDLLATCPAWFPTIAIMFLQFQVSQPLVCSEHPVLTHSHTGSLLSFSPLTAPALPPQPKLCLSFSSSLRPLLIPTEKSQQLPLPATYQSKVSTMPNQPSTDDVELLIIWVHVTTSPTVHKLLEGRNFVFGTLPLTAAHP